MDCEPFLTWVHVVLIFLLWGMIGYWWMMVRKKRRELRDLAVMRAQVEHHLAHATRLLDQLDRAPWAAFIDDTEPPVH